MQLEWIRRASSSEPPGSDSEGGLISETCSYCSCAFDDLKFCSEIWTVQCTLCLNELFTENQSRFQALDVISIHQNIIQIKSQSKISGSFQWWFFVWQITLLKNNKTSSIMMIISSFSRRQPAHAVQNELGPWPRKLAKSQTIDLTPWTPKSQIPNLNPYCFAARSPLF